jgi:hypothetical protein
MEVFQMWNVTRGAVLRVLPVIALALVAGCAGGEKSFTAPTSLSADLGSHGSGNVTLPNPTVTPDVTTICESVTISWTNVPVSEHSANRWHIQLDNEPTFTDPVIFNDAQYGSTSYGPIALTPGTYWFRVKAMSTEARVRNSDFVVISFTVIPCPTGCTLTQGYWKNHADAWPVSSLTLGTVSYTQSQLLAILGQPVAGNGLISLAHQLIAARLNIATGASGSAISSSIAAADALIGGLVVPPVGSGVLAPATTSALVTALDNYNQGITGPGHCEDQ